MPDEKVNDTSFPIIFVISICFLTFLVCGVWSIGELYAGKFIYPIEYQEWTNITPGYDTIDYDKTLYSIREQKNDSWGNYGVIYYKKYPTEVDRLRIVEPPDYGASLPIRGKLVLDKLFYNESVNAEWRINECVDTKIILEVVHENKRYVYVDTIPQTCMCG